MRSSSPRSTRHHLPNRFGHVRWTVPLALAALAFLPAAASAVQEVTAETGFVLNTYSFLVWGALVMWMCAGFTMLESGSVRSKNASMICLKNIGLYSIAGIAYYVIGYGLMYTDVGGGFIGALDLFYGPSAEEVALLSLDPDSVPAAAVAEATAAVVERKQAGWKNAEQVWAWRNSLRRYAFPRIGTRPVSEVESADVLAILSPIWHSKPTIAKAVRQRIHAVLEWAIAMNLRNDNSADRVRPVLGPQRNFVTQS